jgi:hypothetical protein
MWHWIHVRASYAKPAAAPHRAQKTAEKGSPLRFEADAVCVHRVIKPANSDDFPGVGGECTERRLGARPGRAVLERRP